MREREGEREREREREERCATFLYQPDYVFISATLVENHIHINKTIGLLLAHENLWLWLSFFFF